MTPGDLTARTIHGGVELVIDQRTGATITPIEPFDAISLARELIGGAISSISANPQPLGTMVSAPDIPIQSATVRLDQEKRIVIDLTIPPGVLFSFRLAPNVAGFLSRELSAFLQEDS